MGGLAATALQSLGSVAFPSFSVELEPWSCPIRRRNDTGARYVDSQDCEPATLTITTTPRECAASGLPGRAGGSCHAPECCDRAA